jgi:hypothetical protein
MEREQLIARTLKRVRNIQICVIVAILIGIVLINTPMPQLGYWILGASIASIGLTIGKRRAVERHLVIADVEGLDSSGAMIIEAKGIRIVAGPEWIECDKNWIGYSRVKGTAIFFKYKEAQQVMAHQPA